VGDLVDGIAEIVLWTHDMEASLRFYEDIFGLQLISPPELANKFLRAGGQDDVVPPMIVLVPHPDAAAAFPASKAARVLHHLAFNVYKDHYEELQRRCRQAGLEVRGGVHPVLPDVNTFYVDDPEGNEVEVISPK
jgi:catechol 2,3-dioxygenase-like lactoylglutathione lyase family enzyme